MKYTLNVKEINTKAAKFHYTVTDETGKVISERKSNRVYVAAMYDGSFYFGRVDLVGKGDHGKQIKYALGWGYSEKYELIAGKNPPNPERLEKLNSIAYLKNPES